MKEYYKIKFNKANKQRFIFIPKSSKLKEGEWVKIEKADK
jgi:hypothetical protein